MTVANAWFQQTFAVPSDSAGRSWMRVVYQDVADGIGRGRSWRGTPYQLGDRTYQHGIAFNATKHLLVHLGKPADRFTAEVGLENNDDTQRGEGLGQGSVTFHVLVGGKEVFTSPVLRRKDGPRPLDVALDGATEFEIRVKDGRDGRGWDQALWAEATVRLKDGTNARLQDLPWAESTTANSFGYSFLYGGKPSAGLLKNWTERHDASEPGPPQGREISVRRDSATGLEVRTEAIRFQDFPAVEWTVYFTNTGTSDTPVLESIQAFDSTLPVRPDTRAVLHWARGGVASFDDFAPETKTLSPGTRSRLQPGGGRSSSQVMPFFNIESSGSGVIAAIGWSGEWAAEFSADPAGQVSLKAGMDLTHLVLHPGETIRTPHMLFLFYEGDAVRGQNLLRQFILAHHRPDRDGQPLVAPITCGNWGGTSAEVHLDNIRKIQDENLPVEYYWIDAEWFGTGGWPNNVGNWTVKKDLYPQGFKPLSDALRASRRELMLWFEPERVYRNTPWHKEHPEWLLDRGGDNLLFNLGIPEARQFLIDFISARIDEFGLGCYRQDFNMDPLPFWRAADKSDRQGISEIRHIEGLYAFWDGLRRRHPHLIIDNCASGGRRLDIETVGRATPFWRTDGPRDAIAHQCHTYGLMSWVPLSATSQDRPGDDYEFRSSMCSSLCLNWWVSGDVPAERVPATFPFAWARTILQQYLQIRPYYYGDYYPLTGYSQAKDLWMGYQMDRPGEGDGMVVALRRPESPYESARFPLKGLNATAIYQVTTQGEEGTREYSGSQLIQDGLPVNLKSSPGSAVIIYKTSARK